MICTMFYGVLQYLNGLWRRHPQKGLSMHYCANARRSRRLSLSLTAALTLAAVGVGCQTLTTAKTGVDTGLSTAQSTKSTADSTKQLGSDLKGEVDKAMGKKGEGGAAAAGGRRGSVPHARTADRAVPGTVCGPGRPQSAPAARRGRRMVGAGA